MKEVVVEVQSRPMPVRPGMNEFLVITTLERGKPVSDFIVEMRGSDSAQWRQGIQDGHSGVYRKAVHIPDTATHLQVKLRKKREESENVLLFPLYPEQTASVN